MEGIGGYIHGLLVVGKCLLSLDVQVLAKYWRVLEGIYFGVAHITNINRRQEVFQGGRIVSRARGKKKLDFYTI